MPVSMKGTSMTRYYEKERFSQRLRHAPKLPNSSLFRHRRHHRMHGIGHGARKMEQTESRLGRWPKQGMRFLKWLLYSAGLGLLARGVAAAFNPGIDWAAARRARRPRHGRAAQ